METRDRRTVKTGVRFSEGALCKMRRYGILRGKRAHLVHAGSNPAGGFGSCGEMVDTPVKRTYFDFSLALSEGSAQGGQAVLNAVPRTRKLGGSIPLPSSSGSGSIPDRPSRALG